jgi:hypothetical protein
VDTELYLKLMQKFNTYSTSPFSPLLLSSSSPVHYHPFTHPHHPGILSNLIEIIKGNQGIKRNEKVSNRIGSEDNQHFSSRSNKKCTVICTDFKVNYDHVVVLYCTPPPSISAPSQHVSFNTCPMPNFNFNNFNFNFNNHR